MIDDTIFLELFFSIILKIARKIFLSSIDLKFEVKFGTFWQFSL